MENANADILYQNIVVRFQDGIKTDKRDIKKACLASAYYSHFAFKKPKYEKRFLNFCKRQTKGSTENICILWRIAETAIHSGYCPKLLTSPKYVKLYEQKHFILQK